MMHYSGRGCRAAVVPDAAILTNPAYLVAYFAFPVEIEFRNGRPAEPDPGARARVRPPANSLGNLHPPPNPQPPATCASGTQNIGGVGAEGIQRSCARVLVLAWEGTVGGDR